AAVLEAISTARRRIRTQAGLIAVVILLVFGAITAVLWIGARDVIAGTLSAGTLGQFVLYAVIGAGSVGALSEVWAELQRAAGGMGRLSELLAERAAIAAPAEPFALPGRAHGDIQFSNVTFHYPSRPDTPALDGFTLRVKPGETIALVGPSGSGKSTVLHLLMRFSDPQSGETSLDGVALPQLDPRALRDQIALVPQAPVLFAASAADNIRYGRLDASMEDITHAAETAEADAFLRSLPEGYEADL